MSILNVNTIANVSGTTAATIDSAGRILQPTKPIWYAKPSAVLNNQDLTSLTKLTLGTELIDTANAYNTTDSKYVVPVTGYYAVQLQAYFTNTSTSVTVVGGRITVNGSANRYSTVNDPQSGGAVSTSLSTVSYFSAGDELEVYVQVTGDTTVSININPTFFSGYLIG